MNNKEIEKNNIFNSVEKFLENIFDYLKKENIDVNEFELDHICYRVETADEYVKTKNKLSKVGRLLNEHKVRNRLIASYKLDEPIIFRERKIYVVEVPQPSEHAFYKKGWQHAEFVVEEDFQNFMKKYPAVNFKTDSINKEINPELKIVWGEYAVKFHHQSLEYVVTVLENKHS